MIRVAHLIHTTAIGGVEASADLVRRNADRIDYRVLALQKIEPAAVEADVCGDGVNSLGAAHVLWRGLRAQRPDVVVSSLWRAVVVGGLYALTHRNVRWVLFVHNTRFTHPVDRVVHLVAMRLADLVLCDSTAAREALVPAALARKSSVLHPQSAVLRTVGARSTPPPTELPSPERVRILYWGRVVDQKRLDRALDLLEHLEKFAPGEFVFEIVAPPGGGLDQVLAIAAARELPVLWHGTASPDGIVGLARGATFFLQLSDFEGLAMSVREALCLGVIPVVTPVGEIPRYVVDGDNGFVLDATDDAAASIRRTAERMIAACAGDRLGSLRARARATIEPHDFVGEFEDVLLSQAGSVRTDGVGAAPAEEGR
jgi:glycosyltransferase involved in cell wall biosynthesis